MDGPAFQRPCKYCNNIPDVQWSPDEWCTHCHLGLRNISDHIIVLAYLLAFSQLWFGYQFHVSMVALVVMLISMACRVIGNRLYSVHLTK